ncbi:helix-turn-helix domain protein [Desulfosporosinus acididurans]|uniref:Helix-turn-helix domain protein n=1 Tax=Desulfosporosinus acididurans TaxID=476652 RepID=A0A0J1FJT4_9FIRM|nr:helix-turn-helix domain-containing protein [Desulfosporosinus acididurans]KLU63700.1 helix-turn-helix domain protein [Desulfosporosinus acididurans]
MDKELITIEKLCEWLNIGRTTEWRWRKEGMPHIKYGNTVRYDKEEVLQWLKENKK